MSLHPPYLVQTKDAEGFWCNVYLPASWNEAVRLAKSEAKETKQTHRAVCGPKRDTVKRCACEG